MTLTKKQQIRKETHLNSEMRMYLAKTLTMRGKEIKCEVCGSFNNLEFHHKKYFPEAVTVDDFSLKCIKCHRNAKTPDTKARSQLCTVFENGKRYCETSHYRFEY